METKKHRWILYFISITILITFTVQFYWNLKNYQLNKQRVENEIQLSLDNAIEEYFADLSKENYFAIVDSNTKNDSIIKSKNIILINKNPSNTSQDNKESSSIQSLEITSNNNKKNTNFDTLLDSITRNIKKDIDSNLVKSFEHIDALTQLSKGGRSGVHFQNNGIKEVKIYRGKKATDSLKLIKGLKTIFVAIQNDTINHRKIDSLFQQQLHQKNININYSFQLFKSDSLYSSYKNLSDINTKEITSKSTFLGDKKSFKMRYSYPSTEAFKRSSIGIILSSLLSLAVISSLFYLLNIINKQKQLAEIKNDLISNITHEFKTPITTVSSALEAINSFNVINDIEKTKKYVAISEQQINKLHIMVEKLLETATLDNEKLLLQKEEINIVNFIKTITQKHQFTTDNKTISFSSNIDSLPIQIDEFHFENAISNLIDNAIKYGGNKIEIIVNTILNEVEINIIDDGGNIQENQQEKIFDKFYRIPKGNTHNVKGFGIGLFYTKKIVEKHAGSIAVTSNKMTTKFKISLPYG